MAERGYRPGVTPDNDCGCCGTLSSCGVFCVDGAIPCLNVSFGESEPDERYDLPPETCDEGAGWDCEPESSEIPCAPDVDGFTLEGAEGGDVANLPLAAYGGYSPEAGTSYCYWVRNGSLGGTICTCPNENGSCQFSYFCTECTCFWSDIPCPPTATCGFDATCDCTILNDCTAGCTPVNCDPASYACADTVECCGVLAVAPDCDAIEPAVCGGDLINDGAGPTCDFVCEPLEDDYCANIGYTLEVYVFRSAGLVIMSVHLNWGYCDFWLTNEVGEFPIDCCEIAEVFDFSAVSEIECCCTMPVVSIIDCCGGV